MCVLGYLQSRDKLRTRVQRAGTAYCVLRTENIFVCWCCVGSDRVAGVGVSLGTLDLVRVDGRPCLGWCSQPSDDSDQSLHTAA